MDLDIIFWPGNSEIPFVFKKKDNNLNMTKDMLYLNLK